MEAQMNQNLDRHSTIAALASKSFLSKFFETYVELKKYIIKLFMALLF
jgi:hypothetical protein